MKFYTIGYGGRKPEDLVDLIKQKNIKSVVDVRLRPDRASIRVFKKAEKPDKGIEGLLARNEISYISLLELGNIFIEDDDWQTRYQPLLELHWGAFDLKLHIVIDSCHGRFLLSFVSAGVPHSITVGHLAKVLFIEYLLSTNILLLNLSPIESLK
jgi:hypothetical protein